VRQQLLPKSITLVTMMIQVLRAATEFNIAPEDGSMPGESLSALQNALYFVVAPFAIFVIISLIVYALTGERKEKTESKDSVLTHIE
jgi:heme/copper-type cytochrome/quinol oxidase subunit 2